MMPLLLAVLIVLFAAVWRDLRRMRRAVHGARFDGWNGDGR